MKNVTDLGNAHQIGIERSKDRPYTEDDFLGFYHEHSMDDASILFIEERGCELYGMDLKNISDGGVDILAQIIHPDELEYNIKLLLDFAQKRDERDILTYFQRFRSTTSSIYNTYLTTANLDLERNVIKCVTSAVTQVDLLRSQVGEHLDSIPYVEKYQNLYDLLSDREKEVIKWVCKGKSVKKIGERLFISHHTVETHKKNIFKKTTFKSNVELIQFALNFGII